MCVHHRTMLSSVLLAGAAACGPPAGSEPISSVKGRYIAVAYSLPWKVPRNVRLKSEKTRWIAGNSLDAFFESLPITICWCPIPTPTSPLYAARPSVRAAACCSMLRTAKS